jgi:iron complex outermembrane recepter protein
MKYFACFILPVFTSLAALAQPGIRGVLSGADSRNNLPVVQLLKKTGKDTVLSKVTMPDTTGNYSFTGVEPGTYILYFSSLYFKYYYPRYINIRSASSSVMADTVVVKNNTGSSHETAVITARKPLFEQQREKLVFNVENSVINIGSNGLESLQKIPGVFVDQNGNININGQQGAQIRINGRLLNMNKADAAEFLRNLDVGLIKKIELSVTPGTAYDAAGTAGVINIILKKNIKPGFNGSAGITHRQSGRYNRDILNVSLNHLSGRWSFSTNISAAKRNSFDSINANRNIASVDTLITQKSYNKYFYNSLAINTGITFFFSPKADITLSVNKNITSGRTDGVTRSFIFKNNASTAESTNNAQNDYRNKYDYTSGSVNYTLRPDSLGSEFVINSDYAVYSQRNKQNSIIGEGRAGSFKNYIRTGDIPNNITLRSFDAQYFHHTADSAIYKAGIKYTGSRTKNESRYWLEKDGIVNPEYDKLRSFNYTENILAGFLEYQKTFRRNSVTAGMRIENTRFNGKTLLPKDTTFSYNRTDFFPFLYIDQRIYKSQLISLTYSRRIERPSFQDLNPFIIYYDPYTYVVGNPRLRPQFTGKIELTYTLGGLPLLKAAYSDTRNAITNITYQNDTALTTFKTVDNLARKQVWNYSTMVPVKIKDRFMSIHYFSTGVIKYRGFYEFTPVVIRRNTFTYFNNTTYSLKNGMSFELGGFYNRGMLYGLFEIGDMWALNFGFQKPILKKKASVKFNASDIFFTQVSRFAFKQVNIDLDAVQLTDTRSITLAFTWRFGIKNKTIRRRPSSAENEKSRVKQAEH